MAKNSKTTIKQRPLKVNRGNPESIKGQGFHTNPERINKNGRPKKWASTQVDTGYSKSQIVDCLSTLLSLGEPELQKIHLSKTNEYTGLERAVASAIRKSIAKGDLREIELILSRMHGTPKQSIDVEHGGGVKSYTIVSTRADSSNKGE